jgi:ubiquinone/menaquinone biosynthesis C-methylase UbiE
MTSTAPSQIYGKKFGGTAPENYERYFVPAIGGPVAADLVAAASLQAGERVLDAACGTGIVARLAAREVGPAGSVAGVDINPGMLAVARATAPPSDAIRWFETGVEAMPLPDAAFDVVLCQLGLQFVADKPAALREMHRVLAPGGRVFISVPTPTRFFNVMEDAFARHIPEAAGFVQMVFSLNDAPAFERLLQDAGFRGVRTQSTPKPLHLPSPREFFWQYVQCTPLASTVAEREDKVRAALEDDVVQGWQEWAEEGGLRYAQPILVATGRKDA